jgi:hypothetical protein
MFLIQVAACMSVQVYRIINLDNEKISADYSFFCENKGFGISVIVLQIVDGSLGIRIPSLNGIMIYG